MALGTSFTQVTKSGLSSTSAYNTGHINSSGIITATKFVGTLEGNVTSDDWTNTATGISTTVNVGIGTTNATSKLTISDAIVKQIFTATNTYAANDTTQCGYQSQNLSDATNTYSALRLTAGSNSPATAQIASIRKGTGQNDLAIQLETGNTAFEALRITSVGKVGIGDNNPQSLLSIYDSANANDTPVIRLNAFRPAIRFVDRSTSSTESEIVADGNSLRFRIGEESDNDTALPELMRLKSDGKLGIGTISPDQKLEVFNGAIKVDRRDNADTSNPHIDLRTGPTGSSRLMIYGEDHTDDNSNWIYKTNSNEDHIFHTGSTERLRIDSGGAVSVGNNASPDGKLHVYSSSAGTVTADADADELVLESSGNTGMSILSPGTGESSIYFGNPGTNGQKDAWIKYYHETHSTTANRRNLVFATGGNTERLRIKSGGEVRIGANSTTASTAGDDLVIEGSSDRGLSIISGTSSSANIYFGDSSDADIGRIAYQNNDNALDFSVNAGSTALRITSTGQLQANGKLLVGTANSNSQLTLSSGSSANAVSIRNTTGGNGNVGILFSTQDHSGGREKAAIYHRETHGQAHYGGDFTFCLANSTGGAAQVDVSDERMRVMRGGGISFKGETSNNNMLDYYEEGTFTPSYSGTHSNISGNQRHARYTRIGNLVFYSLEYYISGNNGSWSSGFEIGGMPYASSLSELYCSPSIGVMYGPGGYNMDDHAAGRTYHLGSQNKIYFKFGTSGVRHLWIQFFHRVEN